MTNQILASLGAATATDVGRVDEPDEPTAAEYATPLARVHGEAEELQAPPERRPHEEEIVVDGVPVRFLEPGAVPLKVIAALVEKWEEMGLTGRYRVEQIDACARATGKGNFPWLVHFRGEEHRWWRVYFGGRSHPGPHVRPIDLGPS